MADTHIQGPVSNNPADVAAVESQRLYKLTTANENVAQNLCVIEESATNPILVSLNGYVETVFNAGTTNTLVIGNSSTPNAYVTSGTINPATLGFQTGKTVLLRARTQLTATVGSTGTAATTGVMEIIVRAAGAGKGVNIAT